jgi:hypothetical protein
LIIGLCGHVLFWECANNGKFSRVGGLIERAHHQNKTQKEEMVVLPQLIAITLGGAIQ